MRCVSSIEGDYSCANFVKDLMLKTQLFAFNVKRKSEGRLMQLPTADGTKSLPYATSFSSLKIFCFCNKPIYLFDMFSPPGDAFFTF